MKTRCITALRLGAAESRSRSISLLAVTTAGAASLALGGCGAPTRSLAEASWKVDPRAAPLVLASPSGDDRTAAIASLLDAPELAGRLDGTMGAPGATLVVDDVTATQVLDQQFTSNGRMYDSYANMRWTSRVQRR